jgi:hypothetical protein
MFILSLLCVAVGCGKNPRSMTYAEMKALSPDQREDLMKKLDGEETAAIMVSGMKHAFSKEDSTTVQKMTLQEMIDEGRKFKEEKKAADK